MVRRFFCSMLLILTALIFQPSSADSKGTGHSQPPSGGKTMVMFKTSLGDITVELDSEKAPITVKNFLEYVDSGFYDGTIFHRVIGGFMLQGGGMTPDMVSKETRKPIRNEADNGLKNLRGTLSMARTQVRDSATSQFFVNLVDNAFLDHGERDFGYAVFAKVTQGLDVIDKIGAVKTGRTAGHADVPTEPVLILSAQRLTAQTEDHLEKTTESTPP